MRHHRHRHHARQGDITLRLFPDECPRTIENFTTHARNGYYDGVIFHRVIKGFMLQTGDPLGACRAPAAACNARVECACARACEAACCSAIGPVAAAVRVQLHVRGRLVARHHASSALPHRR